MQLNPSEISELIKKKIENFDVATESHTEGTVVSLTDGIARSTSVTASCRVRGPESMTRLP